MCNDDSQASSIEPIVVVDIVMRDRVSRKKKNFQRARELPLSRDIAFSFRDILIFRRIYTVRRCIVISHQPYRDPLLLSSVFGRESRFSRSKRETGGGWGVEEFHATLDRDFKKHGEIFPFYSLFTFFFFFFILAGRVGYFGATPTVDDRFRGSSLSSSFLFFSFFLSFSLRENRSGESA